VIALVSILAIMIILIAVAGSRRGQGAGGKAHGAIHHRDDH